MPVERAIPLALSGKEIKTAILDRISRALDRDGNLNNHVSFDGGFEAEISIKLKTRDVSREYQGQYQETVSGGDTEGLQGVEPIETKIEMKSTDPNQTRVETGQDVPVAVKNSEGRDEIRGAKYSRDHLKKDK
jgi:hypothetical protein